MKYVFIRVIGLKLFYKWNVVNSKVNSPELLATETIQLSDKHIHEIWEFLEESNTWLPQALRLFEGSRVGFLLFEQSVLD